jgi:thymidylate synthase
MDIPVLHVTGNSLAETYEKGLIELWQNGCRMPTAYDKPGDPLSLDCTMNLTVLKPWSDPMIHKFFIGGIADLREYVYELEGLKDCICRNENDPKDTRWEYLYSSRMTNYGTWLEKVKGLEDVSEHHFDVVAKYDDGSDGIRTGHFEVNQVENVIQKLVKQPFTRQAQMILWMPQMDSKVYDPPCCQSLHFRLTPEGKGYSLNTNIRFRSNDSSRAFFHNCFGFIQFVRNKILFPLQERLGCEINYGRLNWQADSWHLYGSEIKNFEERFINRLKVSNFEDRVLNFHDPDIQEMYHECEPMILQKFEDVKKSFGIVS